MIPPIKIANVVVKGKYIPTAISIGDGELIKIRAIAKNIPAKTSGHAISPLIIPLDIIAISPACGAGKASLPMPLASCNHMIGRTRTSAAAITPMLPPICIRYGVAPRI